MFEPPLAWVRQVVCADPVIKRCKGGALRADGYAHHPYSFDRRPGAARPGADNVTLATLGRLSKQLHKLRGGLRVADGQTVTRTVTLRAKGALPESLPPRPVVSEPWLISFAAPVERRLILTADGPVSESVWTWQMRPETGEPGVIPPAKIPFFNALAPTQS